MRPSVAEHHCAAVVGCLGSIRNHQPEVTPMSLPDFSAEASLYRTSSPYNSAPSVGAGNGPGGQVVLNLIYRVWCTPCLFDTGQTCSLHGHQTCCTSAPRIPPCWKQSCCPPNPPKCMIAGKCTMPACDKDTPCSWNTEYCCCLKKCFDLATNSDCFKPCAPSDCQGQPEVC